MHEEIKRLRREGHSYSEIAKKSRRSKKFVWKIANKIRFNRKGRNRYQEKVKGILRIIKPQEKTISTEKARIISHLFFDGMFAKYGYNHLLTKDTASFS